MPVFFWNTFTFLLKTSCKIIHTERVLYDTVSFLRPKKQIIVSIPKENLKMIFACLLRARIQAGAGHRAHAGWSCPGPRPKVKTRRSNLHFIVKNSKATFHPLLTLPAFVDISTLNPKGKPAPFADISALNPIVENPFTLSTSKSIVDISTYCWHLRLPDWHLHLLLTSPTPTDVIFSYSHIHPLIVVHLCDIHFLGLSTHRWHFHSADICIGIFRWHLHLLQVSDIFILRWHLLVRTFARRKHASLV